MTNENPRPVLSCLHGSTLAETSWKEVKTVIARVHKHVCGHATLTDFRTLLEQNDLWNDGVSKYTAHIMGAARHVLQQPHLGPVAMCQLPLCLKVSMKPFVLITSTLTMSVCFMSWTLSHVFLLLLCQMLQCIML